MSEYHPEFNHFIRRLRSLGHTGEGISILLKGAGFSPDVFGLLDITKAEPVVIQTETGNPFKWYTRHGAGTMSFAGLKRSFRHILVTFDRRHCRELEDYVRTRPQ